MGYSCPVCGDPQADDEHLANHLAFTALIRGGDHEGWLDAHVPEWESLGEAELGEVVSDLADSEEYPQVFEDTTGQEQEHGQRGHDHSQTPAEDLPTGADSLAGVEVDDAEDVLAEARELTEQRHDEDGEATDDETADDEQSATDPDS